MSEYLFLPQLPLAFSQLAMFGALLLAGLLAGEAARRYFSMPRITGYVLAGVLLGPQATGLLDSNALYDLRLVVDLAIGLVVFELGFRLSFDWLSRNRWLFATAIAESVLCFCAIYGALVYFDFRPLLAATAAAIGAATSPPVVMLVAQELRAEGQITERMLLFTAVNTVFAFVMLTLLLPFRHIERAPDWQPAVLYPIYVLAGSALAGYLACSVLLALARWLGKREGRQLVLLVAMVVLTIGIAHSLKLSVPLALVTFGMLSRNLDRRHALLPVRFGELGQLFFVVLFVITGASLEFQALGVAAAGAVAAFVVLRFLGKALAILLFGHLSGIRPGGAGLLAIALLPMSGLAVVMVRDTVSLYPSFGRELAAVVLSAVVVLELLGPLATQFALRRAGEAHPDV
ncbi:MAG TPA: cation:proton antiporter [Burkholderiales bacterium]|nr:cation:proton antiporter [Burkholderiales bacterium]